MRRVLTLWAMTALAPAMFAVAHAGDSPPKRPTPEAVKAALTHMAKARELYQSGDYPDAIAELETARALDPYAKDLVYNLGIVHERALHIDDALRFYRLFLDMDITQDERARTEAVVRRLEGARLHVQPTSTASVAAPATETAASSTPPPAPRGRLDALTIGAAGISVAGLGVGIGFGVLALSTRPASGTTTNPMFPYSQLQSQTDTAHTYAIVSDVGFATTIVFTAVTLGLFFGRTRTSTPPRVVLVPQRLGIGLVGTF